MCAPWCVKADLFTACLLESQKKSRKMKYKVSEAARTGLVVILWRVSRSSTPESLFTTKTVAAVYRREGLDEKTLFKPFLWLKINEHIRVCFEHLGVEGKWTSISEVVMLRTLDVHGLCLWMCVFKPCTCVCVSVCVFHTRLLFV